MSTAGTKHEFGGGCKRDDSYAVQLVSRLTGAAPDEPRMENRDIRRGNRRGWRVRAGRWVARGLAVPLTE